MFKAGTDCALGWSESCFSFSAKNRLEPGILTTIYQCVYLVHQYKSRKALKYRKGHSIQVILSANAPTDGKEMTDRFAEVKERASLAEVCERLLDKAPGGKYVCPCCGSGSGPKRTSAFSIKGERWACFACDRSGDVFDLVGAVMKEDDPMVQLEEVKRMCGDAVPDGRRNAKADSPRFSPEAMELLSSHGLSTEAALRHGISFDPGAKRLVIPFPGSDGYHVDRDCTGRSTRKYLKPKSEEEGPQPVWNPDAFQKDVVFAVEGPFDAIAVEEAGFASTALCGTSYARTVERLVSMRYRGRVVVMLDNDAAGRSHARDMAAALREAGITCIEAEYPAWWPVDCDEADPAAQWAADGGRFGSFLKAEETRARQTVPVEADFEKLPSGLFSAASIALALRDGRHAQEALPTGIASLDEALGGGLYPGLSILGAPSGCGKTALALQVAENAASNGVPVLFATLEQPAYELVARGVARRCGLLGVPIGARRAMDSGTLRGMEAEAFNRALTTYVEEVGAEMVFMDRPGAFSAEGVADEARALARSSGRAPLVVVDYLQLLAAERGEVERQAVTRSVIALKAISKELACPVLAISSLNRGGYKSAAMDAFKESGSVEYTADLLLALSEHIGRGEKRPGRDAVRAVDACVLKNRFGPAGGATDPISLAFEPASGHFRG